MTRSDLSPLLHNIFSNDTDKNLVEKLFVILNEQRGISLSVETLKGMTIDEKVKYVMHEVVESIKQKVEPVEHPNYEMPEIPVKKSANKGSVREFMIKKLKEKPCSKKELRLEIASAFEYDEDTAGRRSRKNLREMKKEEIIDITPEGIVSLTQEIL
jgi:hypothetical protein